ncbi:MAG: response regulator transcription factor [Lachnospiraceae bacterium]|nr:response regulator transcription factor [Lachnospiraceae bacterium]
MYNILIVEDDSRLNQAVCKYLNDSGYSAQGVLSAMEAYDVMYHTKFDLIISDIMMPQIDGFEFAETIRETDQATPILFMTAKDDMPSKSKGYLAGIDDYMVKPIIFEELLLHVGALLRRAGIATNKILSLGNFCMDGEEMTVSADGEDIPVTVREFNILFKMLSYPKKAFSRSQLMEEFWDADSDATLRAVDMYIAKLRDKFADRPEFKIVTVYGMGYKAVIQ